MRKIKMVLEVVEPLSKADVEDIKVHYKGDAKKFARELFVNEGYWREAELKLVSAELVSSRKEKKCQES